MKVLSVFLMLLMSFSSFSSPYHAHGGKKTMNNNIYSVDKWNYVVFKGLCREDHAQHETDMDGHQTFSCRKNRRVHRAHNGFPDKISLVRKNQFLEYVTSANNMRKTIRNTITETESRIKRQFTDNLTTIVAAQIDESISSSVKDEVISNNEIKSMIRKIVKEEIKKAMAQ